MVLLGLECDLIFQKSLNPNIHVNDNLEEHNVRYKISIGSSRIALTSLFVLGHSLTVQAVHVPKKVTTTQITRLETSHIKDPTIYHKKKIQDFFYLKVHQNYFLQEILCYLLVRNKNDLKLFVFSNVMVS